MAHKILETAQSPNSPFPLWIWGLVFGLGLGLVNKILFNMYTLLLLDTCF